MRLPPEFDYEKEIDTFVSAMAYKLHHNRHKGRWENIELGAAFRLLEKEVEELREAISRDSPIEVLMETADVANFALIIASIRLRELGVALAPGGARPAAGSSTTNIGPNSVLPLRTRPPGPVKTELTKEDLMGGSFDPAILRHIKVGGQSDGTVVEVALNPFAPHDFTPHGMWMDGNKMVSRMWKGPAGLMYYEDVEEARAKKLPICPFPQYWHHPEAVKVPRHYAASPDEGLEGK